MKTWLNKIVDSNLAVISILIVFFLSVGITLIYRGGKDLKVGLHGVEQAFHQRSIYENPTDETRTIYRYAPGITILQYPFLLGSKMTGPFAFDHILPSVFLWYFVKIIALLISAFLLLKLIPAASREIQIRNLKLSFLLALPFIGYELTNSQNKILALCFMLIAIFLFEKKWMILSAISFCLALTIYIPLLFFTLYFFIKGKGRFVVSFIIGVLIVFFIAPALILGTKFYLYSLNEWYVTSLKPFFFTHTFASYVDVRHSSQSIPSAIGRIFAMKKEGVVYYSLSPVLIHILIRIPIAIIVATSCFTVWRNSKASLKGLEYSIFLLLALITPSYCLYYTWSWMFVVYFAVFNYLSFQKNSKTTEILLLSLLILVPTTITIVITPLLKISLICWATVSLWVGMIITFARTKTADSSLAINTAIP